jgi:hypothetical protein
MPNITHGDVGDTWVPQATFKVAGVNTDPTLITVKVRDAAGTVSTLGPVSGATGGSGIVRVSAGVFNTVIPITAAGYWYANFTGTGTAAASEDHEYVADPSGFTSNWGLDTRALVGLGETKDWLQAQQIDTGEDLELVRVINDISNRFHQEAEREFKVDGTNPQTRTFIAEPVGRSRPWYIDGDYIGDLNPYRRRIDVGDMAAMPTQVQLMDTDWTTVLETVALADITALPTPRRSGEPITALEFHSDVGSLSVGQRVAVTGTFGFPSVPGDVRQAVLDAVAATMDRDVEHYRQDLGGGVLGGASRGGEGTTVIQIGGRSRMLSMPPASLAVAWRYRATMITVG